MDEILHTKTFLKSEKKIYSFMPIKASFVSSWVSPAFGGFKNIRENLVQETYSSNYS